MTRLFRRAGSVTVGTILLETSFTRPTLDFSFSVTRSLKPEPNTAEIAIRNLSRASRSQLEEATVIPCEVTAGYEQQTTLIYSGTLRTAVTERSGPTLITTIGAGDGEKKYQQSRINVPIVKGTTNSKLVQQLIAALQIGEGNFAAVSSQLDNVAAYLPQGGVLSGSAAQIFTRVTQSLGFEWSIQGDALQLLKVRTPIVGTAVLLRSVGTENTGLIGTPSVNNKGVLSARTLMIPDIFPGRLIVLESERLAGNYRCETCKYIGDTAGQDWYIDIEASRL